MAERHEIVWVPIVLEALSILVKYFLEKAQDPVVMMDPHNEGIFEDEFATLLGKSVEETHGIIEELRQKDLVVVRERARSVMLPTVWPTGKGVHEGTKEMAEPEHGPEPVEPVAPVAPPVAHHAPPSIRAERAPTGKK